MNDFFIVGALALLQGFTEFLPVSSTAHLILAEWLLGLNASAWLSFDVALHVGTALAVIWYFRRQWLEILRSKQMLLAITLGTIPAAMFGFLFEDISRAGARTLPVIIGGLVAGSILIWFGERVYKNRAMVSRDGVLPYEGLAIGFFQALAIIPGISRSGATISAGLLLGKERVEATRFSFLLSTPVIIAAAAKIAASDPTALFTPKAVFGMAVAFAAGLAAIAFLIRFAKRASLMPFVYYRIALALILAATIAI